MLERVDDLPFPWRFALRTALAQRARQAARWSLAEWWLLVSHRLAWGRTRAVPPSPAHKEAQEFVQSVCDDVATTSELGALVHYGGPYG